MSEKIVQLNEEVIKGQIKELVRGSVEETLNELLEQDRQGYRSGHYDRNLTNHLRRCHAPCASSQGCFF